MTLYMHKPNNPRLYTLVMFLAIVAVMFFLSMIR